MVKKKLPFKSIKVTLSTEALSRLNSIVNQASFRSFSSGVEECIRAVYDIMEDIYAVIGERDEPIIGISEFESARAFERIGMRMSRFTGRSITPAPRE